MPGSTAGSGGKGDGFNSLSDHSQSVGAAALKYAAAALAVALCLFNLRRASVRVGRLAERLQNMEEPDETAQFGEPGQ